MNTSRLVLAVPLLLLALILLTPHSEAAQREARTFFQFTNGTRSLQKIGNKRWAQFINGQQTRQYDEVSRNQEYIEIYTEVPAPTWVRIFNGRVLWRGANEINWRIGNNGTWVTN